MKYKELLNRAEKGDAKAKLWLGHRCVQGTNGAPEDTQEALQWYVEAADSGEDAAYIALFDLYDKGEIDAPGSTVVDWLKAIESSSKLSEENRMIAAVRLAHASYNNLYGLTRDVPYIIELLKKYIPSAAANSIHSHEVAIGGMILGDAYWEDIDTPLEQKYKAQYAAYLKGKTAAESVRMMDAVDSDFRMIPYCRFQAGNALYLERTLNGGDYNEVENLWRQVAYDSFDKGGVRAQAKNNLGQLLISGASGVEKNPQEGWKLIGEAVAAGNMQARWFTACEFYDRQEYDKAKIHYDKLVADSNPSANLRAAACMQLSKMYRFGRGVKEDVATANDYLKRAADLGDAEAADVANLIMKF